MNGFSCMWIANFARGVALVDDERQRWRWFASWLLGGLLVAASALAPHGAHADDETPVPAAAGYVVDTTGSVSAADRERLVGLARQINQSTGAQLFTVIVDHTDP